MNNIILRAKLFVDHAFINVVGALNAQVLSFLEEVKQEIAVLEDRLNNQNNQSAVDSCPVPPVQSKEEEP